MLRSINFCPLAYRFVLSTAAEHTALILSDQVDLFRDEQNFVSKQLVIRRTLLKAFYLIP